MVDGLLLLKQVMSEYELMKMYQDLAKDTFVKWYRLEEKIKEILDY